MVLQTLCALVPIKVPCDQTVPSGNFWVQLSVNAQLALFWFCHLLMLMAMVCDRDWFWESGRNRLFVAVRLAPKIAKLATTGLTVHLSKSALSAQQQFTLPDTADLIWGSAVVLLWQSLVYKLPLKLHTPVVAVEWLLLTAALLLERGTTVPGVALLLQLLLGVVLPTLIIDRLDKMAATSSALNGSSKDPEKMAAQLEAQKQQKMLRVSSSGTSRAATASARSDKRSAPLRAVTAPVADIQSACESAAVSTAVAPAGGGRSTILRARAGAAAVAGVSEIEESSTAAAVRQLRQDSASSQQRFASSAECMATVKKLMSSPGLPASVAGVLSQAMSAGDVGVRRAAVGAPMLYQGMCQIKPVSVKIHHDPRDFVSYAAQLTGNVHDSLIKHAAALNCAADGLVQLHATVVHGCVMLLGHAISLVGRNVAGAAGGGAKRISDSVSSNIPGGGGGESGARKAAGAAAGADADATAGSDTDVGPKLVEEIFKRLPLEPGMQQAKVTVQLGAEVQDFGGSAVHDSLDLELKAQARKAAAASPFAAFTPFGDYEDLVPVHQDQNDVAAATAAAGPDSSSAEDSVMTVAALSDVASGSSPIVASSFEAPMQEEIMPVTQTEAVATDARQQGVGPVATADSAIAPQAMQDVLRSVCILHPCLLQVGQPGVVNVSMEAVATASYRLLVYQMNGNVVQDITGTCTPGSHIIKLDVPAIGGVDVVHVAIVLNAAQPLLMPLGPLPILAPTAACEVQNLWNCLVQHCVALNANHALYGAAGGSSRNSGGAEAAAHTAAVCTAWQQYMRPFLVDLTYLISHRASVVLQPQQPDPAELHQLVCHMITFLVQNQMWFSLQQLLTVLYPSDGGAQLAAGLMGGVAAVGAQSAGASPHVSRQSSLSAQAAAAAAVVASRTGSLTTGLSPAATYSSEITVDDVAPEAQGGNMGEASSSKGGPAAPIGKALAAATAIAGKAKAAAAAAPAAEKPAPETELYLSHSPSQLVELARHGFVNDSVEEQYVTYRSAQMVYIDRVMAVMYLAMVVLSVQPLLTSPVNSVQQLTCVLIRVIMSLPYALLSLLPQARRYRESLMMRFFSAAIMLINVSLFTGALEVTPNTRLTKIMQHGTAQLVSYGILRPSACQMRFHRFIWLALAEILTAGVLNVRLGYPLLKAVLKYLLCAITSCGVTFAYEVHFRRNFLSMHRVKTA